MLKIALYNENLGELEILLGQLDQCAREYLRFVAVSYTHLTLPTIYSV